MRKDYEELTLQVVWLDACDIITNSPNSNDNPGGVDADWDQ